MMNRSELEIDCSWAQERFGSGEWDPAGWLHEDAFPGALAQDRWQRLILESLQ